MWNLAVEMLRNSCFALRKGKQYPKATSTVELVCEITFAIIYPVFCKQIVTSGKELWVAETLNFKK